MNAIGDLEEAYVRFTLGFATHSTFIDWAIKRLLADDEGDDVQVVLLASAQSQEESVELTKAILRRYAPDAIDPQYVVGKEIVELRQRYLNNDLSITELDSILCPLYGQLGYPSWMVMLARNCEYATDVDAFRNSFELEFEYIARLWASSATTAEFQSVYCRDVSRSHDWRPSNDS